MPADAPSPAPHAKPPLHRAPIRMLRTLWNPQYLSRLGTLHQHKPRPWRIPARYALTACPADPPGIVIVTPSFNQAQFLERTMRSVLDQRYPALQYVVMDGGSGDGSAQIIERYAEQLHAHHVGPDGGQADAINRGFARTDAPIMAYLNSDDVLLPGSLAYVASYFQQHPEVDAVYGHRVVIDGEDREVGRWIMPPHEDVVLRVADYVPQETLFWRRSLWDRAGAGLDTGMKFALDWELLLRFAGAGARFKVLPRFLGAFRVHSEQKTSADWERVGLPEVQMLRERAGTMMSRHKLKTVTRPYLRRHVYRHFLWRLGVLRY